MRCLGIFYTACLFLLVAIPALAQQRTGPVRNSASSADTMSAFSDMLQDLVERVDPAVVQIITRGFALSNEGGASLIRSQRGMGSGVVVDPKGYIVTNAHVVGIARQVQVLLPEAVDEEMRFTSVVKPAGKLLPARVLGMDRETDIAVLKIDGENLPHLDFGDSEQVRQGQVAVAFGSPFGLENSVTMGVVSSVARQVSMDDPMIYIQTDAAINPGNSGGPLVNVRGEIIGINAFIVSPSGANDGIGFAVPANIARVAYEQIRKYGRVTRGQIGVVAQTITPSLAEALSLPQPWGVLISDVAPKSAAEAAGLEVKDVVLSFEGKAMENARQFGVNIYQHAGDTVSIELLRNGQKVTRRVAVLERPRDPDRVLSFAQSAENLIAKLGLVGVDLTGEVMALMPPVRRFQGVVVAGVIADLSADDNSLRPGDVIYEVNNQRVTSLADLRAIAANLQSGSPVALLIERLGQTQFLLLELP
ncbi:MAG: trypsin-like peptidase domain-containing protein [Bryobacterales bacterium]|nr:trypsin-like peptidase domain-containing protein [Bryobacterales bacterium]